MKNKLKGSDRLRLVRAISRAICILKKSASSYCYTDTQEYVDLIEILRGYQNGLCDGFPVVKEHQNECLEIIEKADSTASDLEQFYEAIESAVAEKRNVRFPDALIGQYLRVGDSSCGFTYTLPCLLWLDSKNNPCEAWMMIDRQGNFYVAGMMTLDGFSSGDTSMFRKENRLYPQNEQ